MVNAARRTALLLGGLTLLTPRVYAQDAGNFRAELEGLGIALEGAVARVSRSSPSVVMPRGASRGYHLEGYGAVFVLSPRALPARRTSLPSERQTARALSEVARRLEETLSRVESEEVRRQIEASLRALRQTEAQLRTRREVVPSRMPPVSPTPLPGEGSLPAEVDLQQLEREVEDELALRTRALQEVERTGADLDQELQAQLEREIRAMHERAEAFRRQADEYRAQAEREVRSRLGETAPVSPAGPAVAPAAPAPPEAPPAPTPPQPLSPPWRLWLEPDEPRDVKTADRVVEDVRTAVTSVLEAQGGRLRSLPPGELVVVAVDFVPSTRATLRPRAQRTLVVRVPMKEIEARRSGRLSAEEFRSRIVYREY